MEKETLTLAIGLIVVVVALGKVGKVAPSGRSPRSGKAPFLAADGSAAGESLLNNVLNVNWAESVQIPC